MNDKTGRSGFVVKALKVSPFQGIQMADGHKLEKVADTVPCPIIGEEVYKASAKTDYFENFLHVLRGLT